MEITIKELFLNLSQKEQAEVGELYRRHFSEGEEPDFLPVLVDFYQQLAKPRNNSQSGYLKISSFSEYDNETKMLHHYQEVAAQDPKKAAVVQYSYYLTDDGIKIQGPPLPTINEEITRLKNEMAQDQWEQTYYPDFSYFATEIEPKPADFPTVEKYQQAQAAYQFGYPIDFIPLNTLIHLPVKIDKETAARLSKSMLIADFLYESYFFGGENVTQIKESLVKEFADNQKATEESWQRYLNREQLDEKLAAFFADPTKWQ